MLPQNRSVRADVQSMQELPEWVRGLAYHLWAFVCQQNVKKTTEMLNAGAYDDDAGLVPEDAYEDGTVPCITVTRQAVNGWKNREGWVNRFHTDVRDREPQIYGRVYANIVEDAQRAQEFLSDLIAGRIQPKDSAEAKLLDVRAKASQDFLNRAGLQPFTRPKDGTQMQAPKVDHTRSIAAMSDEEKRRLAMGEDS